MCRMNPRKNVAHNRILSNNNGMMHDWKNVKHIEYFLYVLICKNTNIKITH